ncbi:hypothetical protein SAMN06265360_101318 [Haloechinothrix alba]|uniref:Uncharacterized protein n=1 Tax=Haloechinothrix alba TaxID=664784 RepID=A0A238V6P2_9PSEU|nr:hypothetical protein [Haloechinothrix alba]SNR29189.1 hypothetical protein SAMN06265360_101318 [Haloechinothrix alba]
MATAPTPESLERVARRRYEAQTGNHWRHASPRQRRAWLRRIEPELRAEHGIAADAVYRDGTWQPAEQLDLFTTTQHDSTDGDGGCHE